MSQLINCPVWVIRELSLCWPTSFPTQQLLKVLKGKVCFVEVLGIRPTLLYYSTLC